MAFKGYENIDLFALYQWSNNFYLLIVGVPCLILFIALIIFLFIFIHLKIKKEKELERRKFNDDEIAIILNNVDDLTNKEKEVLNLMLLGKTRKEMMKELFVSESTVKTHINHIYQKLEIEGNRRAFNKKMHELINIDK